MLPPRPGQWLCGAPRHAREDFWNDSSTPDLLGEFKDFGNEYEVCIQLRRLKCRSPNTSYRSFPLITLDESLAFILTVSFFDTIRSLF